jgi:hypothetical protein
MRTSLTLQNTDANTAFFRYAGYIEPIPCEISDEVFTNLNTTYKRKCWVEHNAEFGEVWFYYPSGAATECSHARRQELGSFACLPERSQRGESHARARLQDQGGRRRMQRVAGKAAAQPAVSMAGAIAKIELGVRVQGEFDWREHAWS